MWGFNRYAQCATGDIKNVTVRRGVGDRCVRCDGCQLSLPVCSVKAAYYQYLPDTEESPVEVDRRRAGRGRCAGVRHSMRSHTRVATPGV